MLTRRQMLAGGVASLLLNRDVIASPVKSMLGADCVRITSDDGGDWNNPYITDGLISMWDGEWNVAGGVHDENSLVWKDLIGENNAEVTNGIFDEFSFRGVATALKPELTTISVEVVFSCLNIINGNYINGMTESDGGYRLNQTQLNGVPRFRWQISRDGGTSVWQPTFNSTSVNTINSYAFTYDSFHKRTYIGGVFQQASGSQTGYVNGTGSLILGNGNTDLFSVRIYNRAFSDDEIAYNYSIDKERFGLP